MDITNVHVYNLEQAIKASKYPMLANTSLATSEITDTTKKLGSQPRGSAHDNFLHGILVSFDLTCSNKMWIEFERYHFADIVSGQSTMHRITKMIYDYSITNMLYNCNEPFNEYVTNGTKKIVEELAAVYELNPTPENYLRLLYNIPSGIELTDHIVTNYGQLKTIWYQRHNHRLPEWRRFCEWILGLKEFKTLTGITEGENEDEQ